MKVENFLIHAEHNQNFSGFVSITNKRKDGSENSESESVNLHSSDTWIMDMDISREIMMILEFQSKTVITHVLMVADGCGSSSYVVFL